MENTAFKCPAELFEEAAPMEIISDNDKGLVLKLSDEQEREIFFLNIVTHGGDLYLCTHDTWKFSDAFVNCPDDHVIGSGHSKFYVLKKI